MQEIFRAIIIFLALNVMAIMIIVLVMMDYENKRNLQPPPKKRFVHCHFCNIRINSINWFGKGWACNYCWDKYDLDTCLDCLPKYKIAQVQIKEIECNNKL